MNTTTETPDPWIAKIKTWIDEVYSSRSDLYKGPLTVIKIWRSVPAPDLGDPIRPTPRQHLARFVRAMRALGYTVSDNGRIQWLVVVPEGEAIHYDIT